MPHHESMTTSDVAGEEARWAVARQFADELAAEAGVTDEDLAWAAPYSEPAPSA